MDPTATEPDLIRTLSEQECPRLLDVATLGRVGFVSVQGVEISCVSYRLDEGPRLFVQTQPYRTLGQLAEGSRPVAFEVDYHDPTFGLGRSVPMRGTLSG